MERGRRPSGILSCEGRWFLNDRYDRCDRWKKISAIVAILWKPFFSDRSDRCDSDR